MKLLFAPIIFIHSLIFMGFALSTSLKDYKQFDEHKLAGYAETIYSYPERDLCYGNFRLINIEYNYITK